MGKHIISIGKNHRIGLILWNQEPPCYSPVIQLYLISSSHINRSHSAYLLCCTCINQSVILLCTVTVPHTHTHLLYHMYRSYDKKCRLWPHTPQWLGEIYDLIYISRTPVVLTHTLRSLELVTKNILYYQFGDIYYLCSMQLVLHCANIRCVHTYTLTSILYYLYTSIYYASTCFYTTVVHAIRLSVSHLCTWSSYLIYILYY